MLQVQLNENLFTWKSEFDELTLGEFYEIEKLSREHENDLSNWVNIIHYLSGIPVDVIEDIHVNDFKRLIEAHFVNSINTKGVSLIEVDGEWHQIVERSSLSAKEIIQIEESFADKDINHWAVLLSIIILNAPKTVWSDLPKYLKSEQEIFDFAKKLENVPLVDVAEWLTGIGIQFLENFKIYDTENTAGIELIKAE